MRSQCRYRPSPVAYPVDLRSASCANRPVKRETERPEYLQRLEFIINMGFPGYFLIVGDAHRASRPIWGWGRTAKTPWLRLQARGVADERCCLGCP